MLNFVVRFLSCKIIFNFVWDCSSFEFFWSAYNIECWSCTLSGINFPFYSQSYWHLIWYFEPIATPLSAFSLLLCVHVYFYNKWTDLFCCTQFKIARNNISIVLLRTIGALHTVCWQFQRTDKVFLLFSLINNLWWCYFCDCEEFKRLCDSTNGSSIHKENADFNRDCSRHSSATWI